MILLRVLPLFWCLILLLAVSGCSDVEEYPFGPGPLEAPERVTDASLWYDPVSSQVVLSWTAPRFSDDAARLVRYEIRYLYDTNFEWEKALSVLNPPAPLSPGHKQQYRFEHPEPGSLLRVAVAAIDDAHNVSPPGNISAFHVPGLTFSGRIFDVLTMQPVPGINLEITGTTTASQVVTDADGSFILSDMRPQQITVAFTGNSAQSGYFGLNQNVVLLTDTELDIPFIPYAASELYPSYSILYFFKQACRSVLEPHELIRKWESLPVPIYIPEYVNDHGIDFRQITIEAVNSWINRAGIALWEVVDQPQNWGVQMYFKTPSEMGSKPGYTSHTNTPEGLPLRSDISVVNSYSQLETLSRVILHELGHTIRLNHLPNGFLMYASHPLPEAPTIDEALIVQILNGLPNWTNLENYLEVSP